MKKYLIAVLCLSLMTAACAKKSSTASRTINRPQSTAQTPAPGASAADTQAQSVGLNIEWSKTDITEMGESESSLTHTFTVNGVAQTLSHKVNFSAPACDNEGALRYDVQMGAPLDPKSGPFTAVGTTSCWEGDNYFLGTSFMVWNAQHMTQQFVLMNLTSDSAVQIQKQVVPAGAGIFLPSWVHSQFVTQ